MCITHKCPIEKLGGSSITYSFVTLQPVPCCVMLLLVYFITGLVLVANAYNFVLNSFD